MDPCTFAMNADSDGPHFFGNYSFPCGWGRLIFIASVKLLSDVKILTIVWLLVISGVPLLYCWHAVTVRCDGDVLHAVTVASACYHCSVGVFSVVDEASACSVLSMKRRCSVTVSAMCCRYSVGVLLLQALTKSLYTRNHVTSLFCSKPNPNHRKTNFRKTNLNFMILYYTNKYVS